MKTLKSIILVSLSLLVLASCSSSLQQRQVTDDLYYTPDKDQNKQIAKEFEKDYEKAIADDEKSVKQLDTVADLKKSTNPYEEILVDDPVEAQERRNKAMMDPSYGITNYYDVRFSDAYWYASAFDPMFYNTIVMGNNVWVEPRWLSSSFRYGYNYGGFYNAPYSSWSFGFSHHPYSSWHNPYTSGIGYGYNYYGYGYSPYNSYYGYGYSYGYSPFYNSYFSFPGKRKFSNRTSISNNPDQAAPNITRYYKNSVKDKRATITSKGRGDKIRTVRRTYEEEDRRYIRTGDRKRDRSGYSNRYDNNSRGSSTYRNNNTVRKYINDARSNSRSRNTRRYYDRPDNESNYNELKRKRRNSYYRSNNNSSSNRNYNRNNNSSFDNNSSSSNRSTNRSSGSSSSGSSSSSSSGRKKR